MQKNIALTLAMTISLLTILFVPVNAEENSAPSISIIIQPDGSIDGSELIQKTGNTYTLTTSLNSKVGSSQGAQIIVRASNIVLDGAENSLIGPGYGVAICVERAVSNVVIKNFRISGYSCGITFWKVFPFHNNAGYYMQNFSSASNIQILNNYIEVSGQAIKFSSDSRGWAIYLTDAKNTLISGNTLRSLDNVQSGIHHGPSATSTLNDNQFLGCTVYLDETSKIGGQNNSLNSKPLVCLRGESNKVVDGAETVFLCDCTNISVTNIQPSVDWGASVTLSNTNNTTVKGCLGHIFLYNSNYNTLWGNTPFSFQVYSSSFNCIKDNQITSGHLCLPPWRFYESAVTLYGASTNNTISQNTFIADACAIELGQLTDDDAAINNDIFSNTIVNGSDGVISHNPQNNIYNNEIVNCSTAVTVEASSHKIYKNQIENCLTGLYVNGKDNTLNENTIIRCGVGLSLVGAQNTLIYNNSFINNTQQVGIYDLHFMDSAMVIAGSINNTFYIDAVLGGNFWSDYNGTDADHDGYGDTPYVISGNITDNYPLVRNSNNPNDWVFIAWELAAVLAVFAVAGIAVAVMLKKRRKQST